MKRSGGVRGLIGVKDFVSMDIHNSGLLGNRILQAKKRYKKIMRQHTKQKRYVSNVEYVRCMVKRLCRLS